MLTMCLAAGCHQSAYTDLYVQQLNNEARQLEDRVYEYDAAYRRLETELDVLQHDNSRLRAQLALAEQAQSTSDRRSLLSPRSNSRESIPGRQNTPPSVIESMPSPRRTEPRPDPAVRPAEPLDVKPAPSRPPGPDIPDPFESQRRKDPPPSIDSELVPPTIEFGIPPSALLQSDRDSVSASVETGPIPRSGTALEDVQRAGGVLVATHEESLAEAHVATDADTEMIAVRPAVAAVAALPRDTVDVDQFRIEVSPVGTEGSNAAGSDNASSASQEKPASESLVELALHPAFTRGFDGNGDGIEESVRILVQPKTETGQIVSVDGELTVVAIDPVASANRGADNPKRLGRWGFTSAELEQLFDPIGSAAGYQLQFSPLESMPAGGQLSIFVRLELPDGRKLVNRMTIQLRTEAGASPVWTPRVTPAE